MPFIATDIEYTSAIRRGRGSGARGLKAKLGYFTYRDDRDRAATLKGVERWIDHGLGQGKNDIACHLQAQASPHVLAWHLLVSPDPDTLALIPDDQRRRELLCEATETIVEEYYGTRGFNCPLYSFVLHDRLDRHGRSQLHSHVVLPGTTEEAAGRKAVYTKPKHAEQLFELAQTCWEQILDRELGHEWRQQLAPPPEPPSQEEIDLDEWFNAPTYPLDQEPAFARAKKPSPRLALRVVPKVEQHTHQVIGYALVALEESEQPQFCEILHTHDPELADQYQAQAVDALQRHAGYMPTTEEVKDWTFAREFLMQCAEVVGKRSPDELGWQPCTAVNLQGLRQGLLGLLGEPDTFHPIDPTPQPPAIEPDEPETASFDMDFF